MGQSRSSSLRIGDDSFASAGSGQARDVPVRSAVVGPQNAPEAPLLPLGKGKKKINLIKYPKALQQIMELWTKHFVHKCTNFVHKDKNKMSQKARR